MLIAVLTVLIVLGLVGGLSFAGLWLCWHGLCGSVVDQHPHCSKCRYDLYGHVALPELCPECGSNLWLLDAVTIGHRKRGFDRVGAGVLCLALSVLPIAWMMHENAASSQAGRVAAAQAANQQQVAVRQPTLAQTRTVYRSAADGEASAEKRKKSHEETPRGAATPPEFSRVTNAAHTDQQHGSAMHALEDVRYELLALLDEENARAAEARFVIETDISPEFLPRYKGEGSDFLPEMPQLKWWEADSRTARDGKALRFGDSGWNGGTAFANDVFRPRPMPMVANPTRSKGSQTLSFAFPFSHASATRSSARLAKPPQSASGSSFTQPSAVRPHTVNTRLRSERLPSTRISPRR